MTAADKPEFVRMRRQDKAVEDEAWIQALLERAPVGVLAMVEGGAPFLNINLFVYDPPAHALYFHTAGEGGTRANIERDPRVCFCVSEMGRLLPADTALEFSVEYASVIVFGRVCILTAEDEARRALQLLLDKYAPHLRPGRDYRPITADEIARTSVFCLDIERWSAKKNQKPADFPGAFFYRPPGS